MPIGYYNSFNKFFLQLKHTIDTIYSVAVHRGNCFTNTNKIKQNRQHTKPKNNNKIKKIKKINKKYIK